jgi:hypothetical protein
MKIRILGFEPTPSDLPESVPPDAGFVWMRDNPGVELNKFLTAAVTTTEGFLAGVVLKARDATSFTKMLLEGGIGKVKSEKLGEGERLAEANFFIVHPDTGRGLYAYHYRSASMTSDFAWACQKAFNNQRIKLLKAKLDTRGLKTKEIAALRKSHRGKFSLSQLLNQTDLKHFLKHIKRVSSFEASFTSFDLEEDIFDPLSKQARRKTVKFQFPPDLALASIEGDLETAAASNELDDFWIGGLDRRNHAAEFHKKKNPLVFAELDYDAVLGNLEMSFDDWPTSILAAEATRKLLSIAAAPGVARILSTAV